MGNFKEYLLTEIKKSVLMKNTDKKRKQLSKEMRVRPPKVSTTDEGWERLDYNVKMEPPDKSVEGRNHRGFIIWDPKDSDVKRVHCDCLDWNYCMWKTAVKNGIDKWKLSKKEEKRQLRVNNHADAKIRNPNDVIFCCKHIYSILKNYT